MARPRKTTEEQIEDRFADMPVSSQARLLERLQLIHRITKRQGSTAEPQRDIGDEIEEAVDVPVL